MLPHEHEEIITTDLSKDEQKAEGTNSLTEALLVNDDIDEPEETALTYLAALQKTAVLGTPLALSYFVDTICDFLVGKILAQAAENDFAASQLVQTSQVWILYSLQGQIYVTDSLVSKYYGKNAFEKAGAIVDAAIILCVLTSIPIAVVLANIGAILRHLGQDEDLSDLTQQFFYPFLICVPLSGFFAIGQQFAISVKKEKQSILADFLGQLTYLFFSYSLILGKFNFPALGVKGWGIARAIQSCATALGFTLYLALNKDFKKYKLFTNFTTSLPYLKELFQLGWPVNLQMLIQRGEQFFVTLFTGSLGKDQLKINGVISRYLSLFSPPQVSLSTSNTILIGQLRGADLLPDAKIMGTTNKAICTTWALMVSAIFIAASSQLASLFLDDDLIDENSGYIRLAFMITAIGYLADSLRASLSGALRGLEDTKSSMFINTFTTSLISIPLTLLMSDKGVNTGLLGLLAAYNSSTVASSLMLNTQWNYRTKNADNFANKNNSLNPFSYTFFKLPKKIYTKLVGNTVDNDRPALSPAG